MLGIEVGVLVGLLGRREGGMEIFEVGGECICLCCILNVCLWCLVLEFSKRLVIVI